MNQLCFIVCVIFTTLIAVSTPKDIRVPKARAIDCFLFTWNCERHDQCCSGICESAYSTTTRKQCYCLLKGVECKNHKDCCTETCTNGVCACGTENVIRIPCKSDNDCCTIGTTCNSFPPGAWRDCQIRPSD